MSIPTRIKTGSKAVALALALGASSFSANAVLERAGPVGTTADLGNYPAWYQDTTGLALEFCAPQNASEIEGGWCLLLPSDIPQVPEAFPNRFFDEHFYFAGTAAMATRNGGRALLVLAEEAAFAVGPPVPGDQIAFSRIRVKLTNVPVSGVYRFIHPYGEELLEGTAGDVIFFSDDVGINCAPGNFDCSLTSRLGPFLLPSAQPGGPEMPALTADNPTPDTDPAHFGGVFNPTPYPGTGKAYIADPGRIGPVTGSPLRDFVDSAGQQRNHNIFRIEGPPGSGLGVDPTTGAAVDWIETAHFNLMGRVMTGAMPGRIAVERASYARNNSGQKLEVFASASGTTQARLPAQPRPPVVAPQLTFFDAPCTGTVDARGTVHPPYNAPIGAEEIQMFSTDGMHWGQKANPASIPTGVCVKDGSARDANGNVVPTYAPRVVTDELNIGGAYFDAVAGTLTVTAASSDQILKPKLTLAYGRFLGELDATGKIVVPGIISAPANVTVHSTALGSASSAVSTSFLTGTPAPAGIPVAANDSYTFAEDSGPQLLAVLGNDTNAVGGTVAMTAAPRLGTATVNADGTVSYTPRLNANGADQFSYNVTTGGRVSNIATVMLNITPVNDAPTAVNDNAGAVVNLARQIKVLANDTDPDGAADLVAIAALTQPQAGATVSVSGGIVTFAATKAGTYTFSYRAQDASGAVSPNTATVTVQVAAAEQVGISRAEYVRSSSRLRLVGSVTPPMEQSVLLQLVNSTGAVVANLGTASVDAAGAWSFEQTLALPAGTVSVRATSSNNTVRNQALSIK